MCSAKENTFSISFISTWYSSNKLLYSLRSQFLFANTYVFRHILVIDTSVLMKSNMDRSSRRKKRKIRSRPSYTYTSIFVSCTSYLSILYCWLCKQNRAALLKKESSDTGTEEQQSIRATPWNSSARELLGWRPMEQLGTFDDLPSGAGAARGEEGRRRCVYAGPPWEKRSCPNAVCTGPMQRGSRRCVPELRK
jgi:hypothetical protein